MLTVERFRSSLGHQLQQECHQLTAAVKPTGTRSVAAVTALAFTRGSSDRLLLLQRSSELRSHAGQFSFPGGKVDPTDESPLHAALRELEEEVALNKDSVEVLGRMGLYPTQSSFCVVPYAGVIHEADPTFSINEESASVVELPLEFLANKDNLLFPTLHGYTGPAWKVDAHVAEWSHPPAETDELPLLWGLTARVIYDIVSTLRPGLLHPLPTSSP